MERSAQTGQDLANLPDVMDTLCDGDRLLVQQYRTARDTGGEDRPEFHRAQHRFLRACVERESLLRAAGVPMRSIADVLRGRFRVVADAQ